LKKLIIGFVQESGSIEYSLIAALISIVCIEAITTASQSLLAVYERIGNGLRGFPRQITAAGD
jgi:Flp pilus assembly pilin Flp